MAFHRLTVPSYSGGLPGGYDYINNATSGLPANANGAAASGPNSGTYFIGFGDTASSANANRPAKALAENCDYLDDLLRRDLAVPTQTADVTVAGVPATSVVIGGTGTWLGASGTPATTAGYETAFKVVDENEDEIVGAGGAECKVSAISGGTFGTGAFSAGAVTLTITPGIPVGTVYHVKYATLGNLATLPVDALTKISIEVAEQVPAELAAPTGASRIGWDGGSNWADGTTNPATTVAAQLDKIITDLGSGGGAEKIRYDGGVAWADGTTNPATNVGAQLDKILSELTSTTASADGAGRIGAEAITSPIDISAGSVGSQLQTLAGKAAYLGGAAALTYQVKTAPSKNDTFTQSIWHPGRRQWLLASTDFATGAYVLQSSGDAGDSWSTITAVGVISSNGMLGYGSGAKKTYICWASDGYGYVRVFNGASWTNYTLPGAGGDLGIAKCGFVHSPTNNKTYAISGSFGTGSTGFIHVFSSADTDLTVWAAEAGASHSVPADDSGFLNDWAEGNGTILVAGGDSGGYVLMRLYGGTWTTAYSNLGLGATAYGSLTFDPTRNLFFAWATIGGVSKLVSTPDGATWTVVANAPSGTTGGTFHIVQGIFYLWCLSPVGSRKERIFSVDGGLTWYPSEMVAPSAATQTYAVNSPTRMMTWFQGSNSLYVTSATGVPSVQFNADP